MSDVDIKYKSQIIASMDASGTKTLETDGTYCDGDIVVEYTKPSGADVSGVTATAADVKHGKVIVGADGLPITGTAGLGQSGTVSATDDKNITIPLKGRTVFYNRFTSLTAANAYKVIFGYYDPTFTSTAIVFYIDNSGTVIRETLLSTTTTSGEYVSINLDNTTAKFDASSNPYNYLTTEQR